MIQIFAAAAQGGCIMAMQNPLRLAAFGLMGSVTHDEVSERNPFKAVAEAQPLSEGIKVASLEK